jgi:hypothetical protein
LDDGLVVLVSVPDFSVLHREHEILAVDTVTWKCYESAMTLVGCVEMGIAEKNDLVGKRSG